ncbi:MAG: hypothetical protein ABIY55_19715, partial [Kofleriaceae bacterium]
TAAVGPGELGVRGRSVIDDAARWGWEPAATRIRVITTGSSTSDICEKHARLDWQEPLLPMTSPSCLQLSLFSPSVATVRTVLL